MRSLLLAAGAVALSAAPLGARVWTVGPDGSIPTIGAALARAAAGDTVLVRPGTYRERLVVTRAVVLLGEGWPVIDGDGRGHVVVATAPLVLRGFAIRGSGSRVDTEDSGVMMRGARAVVAGNRIEDTLYGVYLKEAPGSVVWGNRIEGKPLPLPRRGDGIRLWSSPGSRIERNVVTRVRDIVVYFCDGIAIRDNVVIDSRYGLHSMYSSRGVLEGNRLAGNQVGAFIMYSRDLVLRDNHFRGATGASGFGLGLKDADDLVVEDNVFADNAVAIHLDNSPRARAATNRFERNAIVANGVGIQLLPAVEGNRFAANELIGNARPVEVTGGVGRDQAARNAWSGNHWGDYAGFDEDGDGRGDTPFVLARISDALAARHPELRVFTGSPAFATLELVGRFVPFLRPEPVAVDSAPRIDPVVTAALAAPAGAPRRAATGAAWALAGFVGLALLARAAGGGR